MNESYNLPAARQEPAPWAYWNMVEDFRNTYSKEYGVTRSSSINNALSLKSIPTSAWIENQSPFAPCEQLIVRFVIQTKLLAVVRAYATPGYVSATVNWNTWNLLPQEDADGLVEHAERLVHTGKVDAALDLIYACVDRLLRKNDLESLNTILSNVRVDKTSLETLITLLTVTLPVRKRLASRSAFYKAVEQTARTDSRWSESLLSGLGD